MIYFIIGLFIGGIVGFVSGALMLVLDSDYERGFKDGIRSMAHNEEICEVEREDVVNFEEEYQEGEEDANNN